MGHFFDTTVEIEFRGNKTRIYKGDVELFEKIKARDAKSAKPKVVEAVKPKVEEVEKPKEQLDNQ